MSLKDEINVPMVLSIGVLSSVLLVFLVICVQAAYFNAQESARTDDYNRNGVSWARPIYDEEEKNISRFGNVPSTQQRVALVPIDTAKQLVLARGVGPTSTQPSTQPAK
jgi:hypothetical protein